MGQWEGQVDLARFIAALRLPVPQSVDVCSTKQLFRVCLEDVLEPTRRAGFHRGGGGARPTLRRKHRPRPRGVCDELEAIDADAAEGAQAVLAGWGLPPWSPGRPRNCPAAGAAPAGAALALAPPALLLDEPTNHLDLDAVLWLERYITEQLPASSTR